MKWLMQLVCNGSMAGGGGERGQAGAVTGRTLERLSEWGHGALAPAVRGSHSALEPKPQVIPERVRNRPPRAGAGAGGNWEQLPRSLQEPGLVQSRRITGSSLEMVVLDPQLPVLVSDPEMEAKASESPCAELAPVALALPWHETGSPPAGEPSQEAEFLSEQVLDQEEQAETDIEEEPESEPEPKSSRKAMNAAIGAGVGIGAAVIVAPVAIWAAGFTGAGIAAGSIAAKMMSAAAIANGGGVAAGSLVATLQSAGAVGLSLGAKVGLSTALGSVGAAVGSWFSKDN
ncbi:hypothetical protein KIL84_021458 [Mauremys mutica]|uniref:Uncharacterized protein n=2 Tax=Mauremys mutica TaxID=74926 RepID=A0A9D3X418_9SAUR|nr:hypothetical protein KIL84_021458 [Mauremys mutica]